MIDMCIEAVYEKVSQLFESTCGHTALALHTEYTIQPYGFKHQSFSIQARLVFDF